MAVGIMAQIRMLVVGDDAGLNALIQAALRFEGRETGWHILSAADGEEAMRIVHEKQPSLIILDLRLPKMNGLDVCRHVTGQFGIPVIMTSAERETDTRSKCLEAGARDYIAKPFRVGELVNRVKTILKENTL